jgi:AcrR family transcriptional regulator
LLVVNKSFILRSFEGREQAMATRSDREQRRAERARSRGGRRARGQPLERRSQAERTALSDRRMLEAAVELITRHGCEKTTLQMIGEAAGYSRGLVSHRHGSKAGLLRAVMEWISERWRRELDPAVANRSGLDALFAFIDAHGRFAREWPAGVRALFVLWFQAIDPESELREVILEEQARVRARVAAWIRAAVAAGSARADARVSVRAAQFCGTLYGITYQWLLDPERLDLRELLEELKTSTRAILAE